jgi:hypothetical protein
MTEQRFTAKVDTWLMLVAVRAVVERAPHVGLDDSLSTLVR